MKPAVTIGVPVYNEEKYLEETFRSISRQTYPELRIIVSDNGSTDRSGEIITAFAKQDSRFVACIQKDVLSAVGNFLFLLNSAKTPYFMWLGGHDFISERYVESCVDQLEKHPHCSMASGLVHWQRKLDGPYKECNEALNTLHMPPRMALLTWLWSFYSCFQVHGVHRTANLQDIGIPPFYSPDVAMMADVLIRGSAVFCGDAIYYATCNRPDESTKDQIRRYSTMGISTADLDYLKQPDARIGRFFVPCRDHILKSIAKTKWSWSQKLWASVEVRRVFAKRLNYIIPS